MVGFSSGEEVSLIKQTIDDFVEQEIGPPLKANTRIS